MVLAIGLPVIISVPFKIYVLNTYFKMKSNTMSSAFPEDSRIIATKYSRKFYPGEFVIVELGGTLCLRVITEVNKGYAEISCINKSSRCGKEKVALNKIEGKYFGRIF